MSCLLVIAAICVQWGKMEVSVTSDSIARVASLKSGSGEVEIWLGSDNIPFGDWASAPKVCVDAKCIAYRRVDRFEGQRAEATFLFCRANEKLPERVVVRAKTRQERDSLIASMAVVPPFLSFDKTIPLSEFADAARFDESREKRLRGDAPCP